MCFLVVTSLRRLQRSTEPCYSIDFFRYNHSIISFIRRYHLILQLLWKNFYVERCDFMVRLHCDDYSSRQFAAILLLLFALQLQDCWLSIKVFIVSVASLKVLFRIGIEDWPNVVFCHYSTLATIFLDCVPILRQLFLKYRRVLMGSLAR